MAFDNLNKLLQAPVYGLTPEEKSVQLGAALAEVTRFHYDHCAPYHKLCDARGFDPSAATAMIDLPYLPTSLFKDALLLSVPEDAVFRTISSSATTTGRSSRVGLDQETSRRQSRCFSKVVVDRLGSQRRKFVVLDVASSIGRSVDVTARASTIRSLLFCASGAVTCLEEKPGGVLELEFDKLDAELRRAADAGEEIVLFGFTFILYAFVVRRLLGEGRRYSLPGSKVIHIGGWKKLEADKVTPEKLIDDCVAAFGVERADVVDFYGFTEQSGMIYPTCEHGVRHMPAWGELIVRDPMTLAPLPPGQPGLLQFLTPIQTSYPGHSVLTEDMGHIVHADGCPCGRRGTGFVMTGRAPDSEVRGCGDIMAANFA